MALAFPIKQLRSRLTCMCVRCCLGAAAVAQADAEGFFMDIILDDELPPDARWVAGVGGWVGRWVPGGWNHPSRGWVHGRGGR